MNDIEPQEEPQSQADKGGRRDLLLILLFFVVFVALVISLLPNFLKQKNPSDELPVALHSIREADYSRDHAFFSNPSFNLRLLRDILIDQGLNDDELTNRLATLTAVLLSPVPTATGTLSIVNTPTPAWTQTPLPTPVLSQTVAPTSSIPPTPIPTKIIITPDTPVPPAPALKLTLSLGTHDDNDSSGSITLNDGLTYRIQLSNTGNATLSNIYVVDVAFGISVTCPGTSLPANTGMLCTTDSPHIVTLVEANAGKVTMTAFASGDHNGKTYSQTTGLNTTISQNPSVSILKNLSSFDDNDSSGTITLGDSLWYQFEITNTGDVTVSNLSVTDDSFTLPVACPPVSLAPGNSVTCNTTSAHTVTASDVAAGEVSNTATASVSFNAATYSDSDTLIIPLSVQLVKSLASYDDNDLSGTITLGDDLWYQFQVTNIGTLTLNNIGVTDDTFAIAVTCPSTSLASGVSMICTADLSHVVSLAEANSGNVQNTATVTGQPGAGPVVRDTSTLDTQVVQNAGLTIVKSANPLTFNAPGQVIDYTFIVSNSGDVTITGPVTVDDDKAANESCPAVDIDPGNSITCTASYTTTQADLDAGSVTNTAFATGAGPGGSPVASAPDAVTVLATQAPSIQIVKMMASYGDLDGSNSITLGDELWYRFNVSNSGNVTLNPVGVTDNSFGIPVTCPSTSLVPGASMLCTADAAHTVTLAEANAAGANNTATVTGELNGVPYSASDTITTPITQNPALALTLNADILTYDTVGQVITYTYTIENSGNVTLAGPFTITDDRQGVLANCASGPLNPTATTTCMSSYSIGQADIDAGSLTNTASVSGNSLTSAPVSLTITALQSPALTLSKSGLPLTYSVAGQTITYTYTLQNNGNVTLSGPFQVIDDKTGTIDPCGSGLLSPGSTTSCSASYTITQYDLDFGSLTNTASGHTTFAGSPVASSPDNVTATAIQSPSYTITKSVVGGSANQAGNVLTYEITLANTGNVSLVGANASDPLLNPLNGPVESGTTDGILGVSETWIYSGDYTVTQADIDSNGGGDGDIDNTASATTTFLPVPQTSSIAVPVTQSSSISMTKNGTWNDDGDGLAEVGETISYAFTVTNNGNVTLTNITLSDLGVSLSGGPIATLLVGASDNTTFTGIYTLTQTDIDLGVKDNTATVTGTPPIGADVTNTVSDSVNLPQSPAIQIIKSSTTTDVTVANQVVPYSFAVSNNGNVTLTGITVSDPNCDAVPAYQSGDTNTDNALDLSEIWTYTCSRTITQAELDAGGNLSNTVTVDSIESAANTDTLDIPITQSPAMTVGKSSVTASLSAPGVVTYDYLVTNTGNVTLTGISLMDDNDNDDMNCPATTLAVGDNMNCTATHTFTQAELDAGGNLTNNVTASSNEAPNALDSLDIPIIQTPAIQVVKSSTTSDITVAGQVVPYSFSVTNIGNITLSGITVTDPNCDAVPAYQSGDSDTDNLLDLLETWIYTCSHTVTQTEMDAGGILSNNVTVDSTELASDTDTLDIPVSQSPSITLTKTGTWNDDGDGIAKMGETISYSFTVTNNGNVTLTNTTLSDPGITLSGGPIATLAVGASDNTTYTGSYTLTQADIDAGTKDNTATVTGTPLIGVDITNTASDSVNLPQSPAIQVVKSLLSYDDNDVTWNITRGDNLWYQFDVTNTGNVTLTNVSVTDDTFAIPVTCLSTTIVPDETVVCTADAAHTITLAEANAGQVSNTATATGEFNSTPYSASDTFITNVNPYVSSVVSGQVRDDSDGDGDLGDNDAGLANVKIELDDGACTLGVDCRAAITNANGIFTFSSVVDGSYVLVENDLPDYDSTADSDPPNDNQIDVIILGGASSTNNVFLNTARIALCSAPDPVNGFVVSTTPSDGATNIPLSTTSITVTFNHAMITTGAESVLKVSKYEVKNQANGNQVTITGVTYNPVTHTATLTIDTSDLDWQAGTLFNLTIKNLKNACGDAQNDVVRSFTTELEISGYVLNSLDSKGIYGVDLELSGTNCGGSCGTTITDLNGYFRFAGFAPGNYSLIETDPAGFNSISDTDPPNDNQINLTLTAGSNSIGHTFTDVPATCSAPTIVSTDPANGATGISLSTSSLTVSFSQPMITHGGGSVFDIGNFDNNIDNLSLGGDVPILNVSYDPDTYTASISIDTSDPQWQAGSQFRLRVKSGLENPCGAKVGSDVEILFTTEAYISGQVTNSLDGNGIYGVRVELDDSVCTLGSDCDIAVTELNGDFRFPGYLPGSYTLVQTNLPGYSSFSDSDPPNDDHVALTLTAGANSTGHLFTDTPTCAGGANFVASTSPANNETGVSLSTITLTVVFNQPMITYGGGSIFDTGNFDNNIDNLSLGGDVPILEVSYDPDTYTATLLIDASDPQWKPGSQFRLRIKDSIKNACDGRPAANLDNFFTTDLVISGQVRHDLDGDGNLTDFDPGLLGVSIELRDGVCTPGLTCQTKVTNAGGFFTFDNLLPGIYTIVETDPTGYISTNDSDGVNDNQITINLVAGTSSIGNRFLDKIGP